MATQRRRGSRLRAAARASWRTWAAAGGARGSSCRQESGVRQRRPMNFLVEKREIRLGAKRAGLGIEYGTRESGRGDGRAGGEGVR